ncbi:MAG: PspC domain-containing protein [Actinomycetota bacterium]
MNDTTTSRSPRRLYRSTDDRKVAGVSGGLGDYFGVDPVLFRLAFVLGTVFGGVGLLAYVIAWLVLPERSGGARPARVDTDDDDRHWGGPAVIGAILVVVGIVTLLDSSSWFGFGIDGPELFWPLALVGGGAWLLLRERGDRGSSEEPRPASSAAATDIDTDLDAGSEDDPMVGTALAPYTGFAPTDDDLDTTADADDDPAPFADEPQRPSIVRLTLGVLLVYFGVVALGGLFDWWEVDVAPVTAIALLITGVGLVGSAFLNRRGWPLLLVGLFLGAVLVPASVIEVPLSAGIGEERVAPNSLAGVDDEYEYGIGQLVIDVRDVVDDLAPGEVLDIDAELGIGQLQIVVPDDVVLDVELDAGMGETAVELPRRDLVQRNDGISAELDDVFDVDGDGEGPEPAIVRIDARVGLGQVLVSDVPE